MTTVHTRKYRLSGRESEVFDGIVAGLSNKEIAQRLNIAPKTVEFHVTNLFEKLHVTSRYHVIIIGARWLEGTENGTE